MEQMSPFPGKRPSFFKRAIAALQGKLKVKNVKKSFFILVIIIAAIALLVARTSQNIMKVFFPKEEEKGPSVVFEEGLNPVKALKVKRMDFKDTLPTMGNIKGFKEVDLKFQVNGIIESINFEEGEKVQEGDIIANLQQRDALLKLKYSDLELKKAKKLFEIGAIDTIKVEQAKLEYESARSELDKTNIYAVSAGLMGTRIIDVGNFVTSNDKIGTFIDIKKVFADFNIIEKDMAKVALKQKADVFVDAYPNMSFAGKIDRIAPVVEGRSRTQNVKVGLDNKEGNLKPGMFTRAVIYTYEKKDALVIPASSVKRKEDQSFVFIIHEEKPEPDEDVPDEKHDAKDEVPAEQVQQVGVIEIRSIKVGYMAGDLIEVEEGLSENDLIVAEVYDEYEDKTRVEIMEIQDGIM
ncbi:MAG: efflux RND transporter periplasmic adaptor subunit [Candidatus Omnitrophota bacterium]